MRSPYIRSTRIILASVLLLAGCSRESRFADQAVVDVCGLVSREVAERAHGRLAEAPVPGKVAPGSGVAGECSWKFRGDGISASAPGQGTHSLSVTMFTRGSMSGSGQRPSALFESPVHLDEIRVSSGVEPVLLAGFGDSARLYQSQSSTSELWMRLGETGALIRSHGGGARQVEGFARAILDSWQDGDVRGDPAASGGEGSAAAHRNEDDKDRAAAPRNDDGVLMIAATVEGCLHTDAIWRDACGRILALDEPRRVLGKYCDLPAESLMARIAPAYAEFKRRNQEVFASQADKVTRITEKGRRALDRQFAEVQAGRWTGSDMESLRRAMTDGECSAVEARLGASTAR